MHSSYTSTPPPCKRKLTVGKAAAVCAGVKQHTDDQVQQAAAPTQDEATYTDAERMYAICMATHARAGATSPARLLCPELFQHVATFLDEWKGLRLVVTSMPIPRRDPDGTWHISCMRRFSMEVGLVTDGSESGERNLRVASEQLELQASLLFEDGTPVTLGEISSGTPANELLWGASAALGGNRAAFRLQLGPGMGRVPKFEIQKHGSVQRVDALMRPRRFRIRVAPKEPELAASRPHLSVTSEPFRVVSKLQRRPPPLAPAIPLRPGAIVAAAA